MSLFSNFPFSKLLRRDICTGIAISFMSLFFIIDCNSREQDNPLANPYDTNNPDTVYIPNNITNTKPAIPEGDVDVAFTINLLGNPTGLAVSKNGKTVYVSNGSGLLEVDVDQKMMVKNHSVPNSRLELTDISSDGLYLSMTDFNVVYIADIGGTMQFSQVLSGSAVYNACIADNQVYAPCFNDRVIRTYNMASKQDGSINPYKDSETVATPIGVCPTPDDEYVAVNDEVNKVIHIVQTETNEVISSIPTGKHVVLMEPVSNDVFAATLEASDNLLIIPFKKTDVVPNIYKIDSLQYADDMIFDASTGRLFIILGIFAFESDQTSFDEYSYYRIPQIICYDVNQHRVINKLTPKVDPSNVADFKIRILPGDGVLIFTSSEALYGLALNAF